MLGIFSLEFLLVIAAFVFWLWMIVDCVAKEPSGSSTKVVWLLVIIFLHVLGAFLYFFIRRPERIRETGQ